MKKEEAELRGVENRASKIHALLKVRDSAQAEVAKLLREELNAVGQKSWLEWCEREFGWQRTQAYNHLNPILLEKDRERKVRNSGLNDSAPEQEPDTEPDPEPEQGPEPRGKLITVVPWAQALSDLSRAIKKYPAASIVAKDVKHFQKTGWGIDEGAIEEYERLRDWLNELIEGLRPIIVTCAKREEK